MTAKCIIRLLDGTWNDADLGASDTNIVRLRAIIARSLDHDSTLSPQAASTLTTGSDKKLVTARTFQDVEHLVFYERGVGTGPFRDRIKGGSFGDGLAGNIRRAYKFLSFHYQPGDRVFIFGFSRGAYTARSLAGYIAAAGLLRREKCTPELEAKAWDSIFHHGIRGRGGTNDAALASHSSVEGEILGGLIGAPAVLFSVLAGPSPRAAQSD